MCIRDRKIGSFKFTTMKKIFLISVLMISVLMGYSTGNDSKTKTEDTNSAAKAVLTGSIADENSGESLVGVEVKLEGTDLKTYTDFDGNFSFKNVKPGEYKLVTNYISYQKKTEVLTLTPKQNELSIKLQVSN
jgi:hypothetical protein